MCSSTSMKPMTASFSTCSTSSTPTDRISSPPMPVSANDALRAFSSRATPAACRSPETSPATNRISRTDGCRRTSGQHGERSFDVAYDGQRNGQRLSAIFARDLNWAVASDALHERLELETQRLAFRGLERNTLDECLQRLRTLCVAHQRSEIDVSPQPIELSSPSREIERQIAALLKDAKFPHPLARHSARGDVRDRASLEREPSVGDVDERSEHGNTDGGNIGDVTTDERAHEIDVVNHQVEDDRNIRPA